MKFEFIDNGQVLKVIEIPKTVQKEVDGKITDITEYEIEKTHHAMKHKPKITPDKTSLAINEIATISLQWLVFDLTLETYVDDTENTTSFIVNVSGQEGVIEPTNGAGEFTFSSAEAGIYKIIVNGEEIEVIVNA
jgi:hypothetical protein